MWQRLLFALAEKFLPVLLGHAVTAAGKLMEGIPREHQDEYADKVEAWVRVVYREHPELEGTERKARVVEVVKRVEKQLGLTVSDIDRDTAIQNAARMLKPERTAG